MERPVQLFATIYLLVIGVLHIVDRGRRTECYLALLLTLAGWGQVFQAGIMS